MSGKPQRSIPIPLIIIVLVASLTVLALNIYLRVEAKKLQDMTNSKASVYLRLSRINIGIIASIIGVLALYGIYVFAQKDKIDPALGLFISGIGIVIAAVILAFQIQLAQTLEDLRSKIGGATLDSAQFEGTLCILLALPLILASGILLLVGVRKGIKKGEEGDEYKRFDSPDGGERTRIESLVKQAERREIAAEEAVKKAEAEGAPTEEIQRLKEEREAYKQAQEATARRLREYQQAEEALKKAPSPPKEELERTLEERLAALREEYKDAPQSTLLEAVAIEEEGTPLGKLAGRRAQARRRIEHGLPIPQWNPEEIPHTPFQTGPRRKRFREGKGKAEI